MKNRCIITKAPNNITNFICLGENDSVVITNTARGIILRFLHDNIAAVLKEFSIDENEIKDKFYNRLCDFLQYGKTSVLNGRGEPCDIDTFDIEQQINEIKKSLKYKL